MSTADTTPRIPRKFFNVTKTRVHDYLYDSAFIISGARDYARTAFKAAMASAQVSIQPVYDTMFSELPRQFPSVQYVYYTNCRLPKHLDRSYQGYLQRVEYARVLPPPDLGGKHQYKYFNVPKKVLPVNKVSPGFRPPSPVRSPTRPVTRGMQTVYRESSAQTHPWQPDGKVAEGCEETPEVLYLDQFEWGELLNGGEFKKGELPADFHTTEIINKMRHARTWHKLVEKGVFSRWLKKRDAIIGDIEMKDWIFREAEIDELQDIRLALLHKLQQQLRAEKTSKTGRKLKMLWDHKKEVMEKKIRGIRMARDREIRKLTASHTEGRQGIVARMKASRGYEPATSAAHEPTSESRAPVARSGYQARRRHANIVYDPSYLNLEDHEAISKPPAWLERCGQDLTKTCSGHHLPRDEATLCERETRCSEEFLKKLHEDLKKARLSAATTSAGLLRVIKPRTVVMPSRAPTPQVDEVNEVEEAGHQAALLLQRMIRGRAVQNLMYEDRIRVTELSEELKATHGLQKEDKVFIEREETKAHEFKAIMTQVERKENAISDLVNELCGNAVSSALDFLEKELRRLKEERLQHAYILIAVREKTMREAAEAGRRQKEEIRRRAHDEMFKQVLGVTQETVDDYLRDLVAAGKEACAEEEAAASAVSRAEKMEAALKEQGSMSTAEQNELIAELVHHFLLPEAHKCAARQHVVEAQRAKLEAARAEIFALIDDSAQKLETCIVCGRGLEASGRCRRCAPPLAPVEKPEYRDDPRWKLAKHPPEPPMEERFPPKHEFRCMLNELVYEAVMASRAHSSETKEVYNEARDLIEERLEVMFDAKEYVSAAIDFATGAKQMPLKIVDYRHTMSRRIEGALDRSGTPPNILSCPHELPSAIRQRAQEEASLADPTCRCDDNPDASRYAYNLLTDEEKAQMLPSELRGLEEMRRCKCDTKCQPSPLETTVTDETESVWSFSTSSPQQPEKEPEE